MAGRYRDSHQLTNTTTYLLSSGELANETSSNINPAFYGNIIAMCKNNRLPIANFYYHEEDYDGSDEHPSSTGLSIADSRVKTLFIT